MFSGELMEMELFENIERMEIILFNITIIIGGEAVEEKEKY